MKIGEFLNIYRTEHNLSMEELANRCGLSKAYISKLEANVSDDNSKQIKPSIQTFNKIANGLNISLTDLLSALGSEQEVTLEPDFDSILDAVNKSFLEEIKSYFKLLNDTGKREAVKRIKELTYIPNYTKIMLKAAARNGNITELPDSPLIDEDINNADDADFL